MKFYLKQGLFPFIYMIFMALIALGIMAVQVSMGLKILFAALNLGLYCTIMAASAYKDGQDAMKTQVANDLERREIIRTGEDRPLKIHEEYKPWKGFVFGLISCAPLLILLVLHTVLYLITGTVVAFGAIAGVIYLMFFIFFRLNAEEIAPWYSFYYTLIALPIMMLLMGIAYILGARKIARQQEMIREKQRKIYGDDV